MTSKTAFQVFQTNLERSKAFLRIFDKVEHGGRGQGRPRKDDNELLRGSLVFAVGALDCYLSDLILEVVPTHAPSTQPVREALKQIAKDNSGLALQLAIEPDHASRKEAFTEALGAWIEEKSFHGPKQVTTALGYVGCSIDWKDFDAATNTEAASELKRITQKRHNIVHRGDQSRFDRPSAQKAVDLVEGIAKVIDKKVGELYG